MFTLALGSSPLDLTTSLWLPTMMTCGLVVTEVHWFARKDIQ